MNMYTPVRYNEKIKKFVGSPHISYFRIKQKVIKKYTFYTVFIFIKIN